MDSSKWISDLPAHPIFTAPKGFEHSLLSLDTLKNLNGSAVGSKPANGGGSGSASSLPLRQSSKMVIRGPDVILAVGNELRIAALGQDAKTSGSTGQYKVSGRKRALRLL